MTLTIADGLLSRTQEHLTNYEISGPAHRLLLTDFPRRVRALFGGEVLLDTTRGRLLHESHLLPVLYAPRRDVRTDLLAPTDTSTHCPFKGDASYWTVRAGDREATDAVWAYPEPIDGVPWLSDLVALDAAAMDAWYDEDEQVRGHLRDPYHRVDVRRTSRLVRVVVDSEEVARSRRAKVLSETGLPNRLYLPRDDVRVELLRPSATRTHCPYKGDATYHGLRVGDRVLADAAWGYPAPLDGCTAIADHLSFDGEDITVEVEAPAP